MTEIPARVESLPASLPLPQMIAVKDWEIDITESSEPVLIVDGKDGVKRILLLDRDQLPELAAGLIRLADHLRRQPPCGAVRSE